MLKQKLADLRDFIKLHNPYFDKGFTDVLMDDATGIVNNSFEPIFPNDTFGNYFYLRMPQKMQFDYNNVYNMGDNWLGVGVVSKIILIAVVKNSSPDILTENLVTTLGRYQDINTRMLNTTYQPDTIIMQELAGVKEKENIRKAMQNFNQNDAIVSIEFNATIPFTFQQLKCISNPCKTC